MVSNEFNRIVKSPRESFPTRKHRKYAQKTIWQSSLIERVSHIERMNFY